MKMDRTIYGQGIQDWFSFSANGAVCTGLVESDLAQTLSPTGLGRVGHFEPITDLCNWQNHPENQFFIAGWVGLGQN